MLIRTLLALALTALVVPGWEWVTNSEVPAWLVIVVYLFAYVVLGLPGRMRATDSPQDDAMQLPVSGPIGALGVSGLAVVWTVTNTLSLLNPRQLAQIIRQARGNKEAAARVPDASPESRATSVLYSLPFEGEWLVVNGGVKEEDSHSWDIVAQRYAHDFVVVNDDLSRHSDAGNRVEHYLAYGQPILAAADGVVIAIEDGQRNAPLVGWGICDFMSRSFIGNYVLIQHADEEFALYAHLVRGSLTVEPGSQVVRGQRIGLCGHSGHSSEPHLHFHVQDRADLFTGLGVPIRFGPLVIDGDDAPEHFLKAGMRVR